MNKKVFISMLVLTITFLVGLYVLKIFFPNEFVMVIENEKLIAIGEFIDNHKWSYYIFGIITSFITYFLYCCAICHRLYLKWYEYLIILLTIIINIILNFIDMQIASHFSICSMLILPFIFGGKLKETCIVYSIHGLAQILSLNIRNFPLYMIDVNSLSLFLMNFECFIWLALFYIIYNYKRKEN